MEFKENPNITDGPYLETNNGHLILNTASPYDRDTGRQYRVQISEENIIKYNNDGIMDILGNHSTIFDGPNELVDEIIKDCAVNRNEVISDNYNIELGPSNIDIVPENLQTVPPYLIEQQYTPSGSKEVAKNVNFNPNVSFDKAPNRSFNPTYFSANVPTVDTTKSAEKTTYCRPMFNIYSQQFIHKTMQRNARLQKLVHKLVLARKREKQDTWNNYINELKNKHGYDRQQPIRISTKLIEDRDTPEFIDDYYNTRFICGQSYPCQHLLHDFYEASGNTQYITRNNNRYNGYDNNMIHNISNVYEKYPYCYPMSSQGRLMMLQKERDRQKNDFAYELQPRPHTRFYRSNTIVADNEGKRRKSRRKSSFLESEVEEHEPESEAKNCAKHECLQTETKFCCMRDSGAGIVLNAEAGISTEPQQDQTTKEELEKVSDNISKLKKKIQENEDKPKQKSLSGIEGKLDTLIKSINTFVTDMKSKSIVGRMSKSTSVCECIDSDSAANLSSDTNDKEKQIFYSMGTRSALAFSDYGHRRHESFAKIDKILHEEMDKSNKIKQDIESLLKVRNDRPCSVHISFDIPTRERSTEVTHSLSTTKLETSCSIEEIGPSVASNSENHMTIAVNTDPLGLLALLRVSTETVKQMLSYMPNIDCYSYLSMLQFPQLSPSGVSHYICNICGAAFRRPSQLSDHIQEHNLANTRDCCVCRHALDTRQKRTALYSCQYCGQRFTRAYCCELHQQSCAKRFGRKHDVTSSLMLLK